MPMKFIRTFDDYENNFVPYSVNITKEGIAWLKSELVRIGHVDKLRLEGIREDRKAVIGGGLSVLSALLDLFGIDELLVTPGALRHGVLYDLIDREDFELQAPYRFHWDR